MRKIAISVGGSILSTSEGFDTRYAAGMAELLKQNKDDEFVISVGGGRLCRDVLKVVGQKNSNKYTLDEIAIATTRINALMLKAVFSGDPELTGDVYTNIPMSPEQTRKANMNYRIVVHGGYMPGVTTDACATLSAEAVGAKLLVNVSDIPYVYDKDPKKYKDAKPMKTMTFDQLIAIANVSDAREPGGNFVFDSLACKLVKRSNIKTIFIDKDLSKLRAALGKGKVDGTVVG